ncbi:MAG: N-acetylneuraminate synthase family protein [Acidobacteria bacterium]|nr:N-acetylneuraminate synthase family protein [Acidobacteriota bacterium]
MVNARERAAKIRLVLTDVDGTLTDGGVFYAAEGELPKRFDLRDGMGVERLRNAGIETAFITRETSASVLRRAEKLKVRAYLGVFDKRAALASILEEHELALEEIAYIGDDVNDLAIMEAIAPHGLVSAPADCQRQILHAVHYRCARPGGRAAFREFAEWLITNRNGGDIMSASVQVGNRIIGAGQPVYVIAEIGINHNGSLDVAKRLIDGAVLAGADAVKFQKRTPELCVPRDQWDIERQTPNGKMRYIEYKRWIELNLDQYKEIDRYCRERNIQWFASCWDEPSVDFLEQFAPPVYKVASASLTDIPLLKKMKATGRPLMISTGMSTLDEIQAAVDTIGTDNLMIAHATSSYPCPLEDLNLRMIDTLRTMYPTCPIGYSGHETGLAPTWAAVTLGATFVERHITLDRAMWGTDQAASVEIVGFVRLVGNIRDVERSMGDGVKRVTETEMQQRKKLRRVAGDVSVNA